MIVRIFTDAEPDDGGPHTGYRGPPCAFGARVYGIAISTDADFMVVDGKGGFEWEPVPVDTLLPWHRVWLIETSGEGTPAP